MHILIIDGQFLIYKSMFSHQKLTANFGDIAIISGIPFGFLKAVIDMKIEFMPDFIFVTFEGHPLLKKAIYPEYKAKGRKLEIDISTESNLVKSILRSMNIPALFSSGYEGEEVSKYIYSNGVKKDDFARFYTNDEDAFALIRRNFILINNIDGQYYEIGKEELFREHGITPKQAREIKILAGCSSDNVPGFEGIGKGFAKYLVKKYGSAKKVVQNIEEKEKRYVRLNEIVANNSTKLNLMTQLTRIETPGTVNLSKGSIEMDHIETLRALECRTLLKGANRRILNLIVKDQNKWYRKMTKRMGLI